MLGSAPSPVEPILLMSQNPDIARSDLASLRSSILRQVRNVPIVIGGTGQANRFRRSAHLLDEVADLLVHVPWSSVNDVATGIVATVVADWINRRRTSSRSKAVDVVIIVGTNGRELSRVERNTAKRKKRRLGLGRSKYLQKIKRERLTGKRRISHKRVRPRRSK